MKSRINIPQVEPARGRMFEDFLEMPPRNDDELHAWIGAFCHVSVPRRRSGVCGRRHVAPFSFIADQFFGRVNAALAVAAPGGGKTLDVAVLNVCDLVFRPGLKITNAGSVAAVAQSASEYLVSFFEKEDYLRALVESHSRGRLVLRNGSALETYTATYAGLSTGHANAVRVDDVELIHPHVLTEALALSVKSADGRPGQDTLVARRRVSAGTAQRLIDQATERGITLYPWCIFDVLERCERKCTEDPAYGTCAAYARCEGRAHDVAGGFYGIDDFIRKTRLIDDETWEMQWSVPLKPPKQKEKEAA